MFHDIFNSITHAEVYTVENANPSRPKPRFGEGTRKQEDREIEVDKKEGLSGDIAETNMDEFFKDESIDGESQIITTRKCYDENGQNMFLKCVCGCYPYIMKSIGSVKSYSMWATNKRQIKALPYSADGWMIYCDRCGISTEYYDNIMALRNRWNSFVLKGKIHEDKNWKDYCATPNGGNEGLRNGIIKVKATERKLNFLEYCYYFDSDYMDKIKTLLKEGMVFNTYGELCLYLNEKEENYNWGAIGLHRKFWRRFFEFGYIGRRIIILKIYDEYLPWSDIDSSAPNLRRGYLSFFPKPFEDRPSYIKSKTPGGSAYKSKRARKKAREEMEYLKSRGIEGEEENLPEYEIYEDDEWEESIIINDEGDDSGKDDNEGGEDEDEMLFDDNKEFFSEIREADEGESEVSEANEDEE